MDKLGVGHPISQMARHCLALGPATSVPKEEEEVGGREAPRMPRDWSRAAPT